MRIAIVTVQVPFTTGGAEILTEMLKDELIKRGHKADIVSIPFKWYPQETLIKAMNMGRMIDLSEAGREKIDKVIAMKFPAYYIQHDNKVLWLMHQHRQAYDIWGTQYGDINCWRDGEKIRDFIVDCDNRYLSEYKKRFTIAQNTSNRLKKYNGLDSTVLYHPPLNYEKLHCEDYEDFVFYPSRINTIKRQRLLVEAAKYIRSDAKVVIAGGGDSGEIEYLKQLISENDLENKVILAGFISEEEKISYYARCLCVYFGAYDEDYGYITLEGFFSEKPVIVHTDSGGPLEFVEDNVNGFILEPEAKKIAEKIDYLYNNRSEAERLGKSGKRSLIDKHMDWDYVIDSLLSE
ncbi:MAG: glycosyltransferase family 4 protein [Huintestinicola sp.]|uniref:glycosyltransferase family 4 protein n=1 Tax=Huintestinicola sp. TaxID=2981661 RepID=UPI003F0B1313